MDEKLVKQISEMVLESLKRESSGSPGADDGSVPIGISARHIHLTREHADILFGAGHEMTVKKVLMGGQFACEECVTVVSGKLKAIENVRVLGPLRKESQLEISKTDSIKLGISAPVRNSGDLSQAEAISVVGPKGCVYLPKNCIVAKRHIHMSPKDAQKFGVSDKQIVSVRFDGERAGVLNDVLIRVEASFTLEMHIDTDEANGLGLTPKSTAKIVK